jgi:hypothetical protein
MSGMDVGALILSRVIGVRTLSVFLSEKLAPTETLTGLRSELGTNENHRGLSYPSNINACCSTLQRRNIDLRYQ